MLSTQVNNKSFLFLEGMTMPNLGSRAKVTFTGTTSIAANMVFPYISL